MYSELFEASSEYWDLLSRLLDDSMELDFDERPEGIDELNDAGGFADFRESATKTNSIIDRLEKLTLPKLEDVEQGLEKFVENREEVKELEDDSRD